MINARDDGAEGEAQRTLVRKLFLAGGVSFNNAKESKDAVAEWSLECSFMV